MKIRITEIEADAQEIKASNSVADGFLTIMRQAFNGCINTDGIGKYDEEEEEEEEE